MDRRTLTAYALMLLVLVVYWTLNEKYGPRPVRHPAADSLRTAPGAGAPVAVTPSPPPAQPAAPGASGAPRAGAPSLARAVVAAEKRYVVETPLYRAEFSNLGARLVSFELKRYAAAYGASSYVSHPARQPGRGHEVPEGDRVRLDGGPTFALDLGSGAGLRPLDAAPFAASESTDATGAIRALTFTLQDSAGFLLRQTWRVRPDSYLLDYAVESRGVNASTKLSDYSITVRSWPLLTESQMQTDVRGLRAVSLVGKDLHRDAALSISMPPSGFQKFLAELLHNPDMAREGPRRHEGVAHWAGVQSHYFLGLVAAVSGDGNASVANGEMRPLSRMELSRLPADSPVREPAVAGSLIMPLPASGAGVQRFQCYFGPADYFGISKQAKTLELQRAVDMGYSWIRPVSELLLWLLRAVDSVVHNFGWTILALATLVRVLLHPLNMSSMKSMRAMQRLQPEIERIRDKHKNDPGALNTATMALYKENNVNPMGGCLPMFVQMPIFFGLYAVLYNAIDLRQAPFVGWIHDLSSPDTLFTVGAFPVHVLPLVMAATGFLSQLFTPTAPSQAPTMYMMNLFMLFIFYNLPSGLVFYWTVMNLLTALQQWLALRGDGGSVAVVVPPSAGKGRKA